METIIFKDELNFAIKSVEILKSVLQKKRNALICIAAGHTQIKMLEVLAEYYNRKEIDLSEARIVGLDEWVGMDENDEGSCQYFLKTHLYDKVNIKPYQITRFNAKSSDMSSECEKMNDFLDKNGPIDILFLGVGMNGHVGFNEPGSSIDNRAYVRDLDAVTKTVGQKYFNEAKVLSQGVTLGLKDLLKAKNVIIQVIGEHKKQVVKDFLTHKQDVDYPVSLFFNKEEVWVLLDGPSASLIKEQNI
jgi:glucosamine-6-phosphate isomerase